MGEGRGENYVLLPRNALLHSEGRGQLSKRDGLAWRTPERKVAGGSTAFCLEVNERSGIHGACDSGCEDMPISKDEKAELAPNPAI